MLSRDTLVVLVLGFAAFVALAIWAPAARYDAEGVWGNGDCFVFLDMVYATLEDLHHHVTTAGAGGERTDVNVDVESNLLTAVRYLHDASNCFQSALARDE
jgi:hypothetical protein